jgi:fatty acid synthase subunit beta
VHPEGLLFATQFTQPALVLTEKASFDDMNSLGLVPSRALFAGHSLGEYAALASAVPLLPVPILVGITFLRGMVMQGAVPRDSLGRSDFGMVACNPQRVGTFFTEDVMHTLVDAIAKHSKLLLEVVNYNVADRQYVVAGHLKALDILSQALSRARADPVSAASDPATLLKSAFAATEERVVAAAKAGKPLQPERGEATIPLPGVDVPFHSRFLLGGVAGFRNVLRIQLTVDSFRRPALVDRMLGCYVPNLVALPFSLERYFAEEVVRRTNSPDLTHAVSSDANWAQATSDRNAYARMLVIELLAYQFASPVQWIATQHFYFSGCVKQQQDIPSRAADSPALLHHILDNLGVSDNHGSTRTQGIRRLVEIGPAMTLVGMAARTLETGLYGIDKSMKRQLLWYGRDADILYCTADGAGPTAADFASSTVGPARVYTLKKAAEKEKSPSPRKSKFKPKLVSPLLFFERNSDFFLIANLSI